MALITLSRPTLILGCGVPGTGKTTLLTEITAKVSDTVWIEKDLINEAFMCDKQGVSIFGGITSDYYHESVKIQSYDYMLRIALANIRLGKNPIVEGNYNKQIRTGYFDDVVFPMFSSKKYAIKIVYCHTNEELVFQRITNRKALRDNDKTTNEEARISFFKDQPILPKELEKYEHVKIDTSGPLDYCVEMAISYLLQ